MLRALDFLGAEVALADVTAGDPVVVRANYYPAWQAFADAQEVPLYSSNGQLGFTAPRDGTYVVRLAYPRYGLVNSLALLSALCGLVCLARWPRRH